MLEPRLPLEHKVIPRVVDDLVEHRGLWSSSPVVLELLLRLLPRVAPEHTGEFGDIGLKLRASPVLRGRAGATRTKSHTFSRRNSRRSAGVFRLEPPR